MVGNLIIGDFSVSQEKEGKMAKPYATNFETDVMTLPVAVATNSTLPKWERQQRERRIERNTSTLNSARHLRKRKVSQGESIALCNAFEVAKNLGISPDAVAVFYGWITGEDGTPVPRYWQPSKEGVVLSRIFCVKFRVGLLVRVILAGVVKLDKGNRLWVSWSVASSGPTADANTLL